jgi:hypothetical protein
MVKMTIIMFLLFSFMHSYATEVNYSKKAELPPLRISFSDLQKILDKAASLMASANSKDGFQLRREDVSLYKGGQRVTISGHILNAERAKLPQTIDEFEYTASASEPAPLTRIEMWFYDFSRILRVEGSSPDQVDAVYSTLRDDLISVSSVIGGPVQRFFIVCILSALPICYIFFTLINWITSKIRPSLPPLAFSVICLIIILVLPVGEILAGFSAIQGDASFLVRYGPVASFLGFIISFVAIPISYWLSKAKTG